MLSNTVVTIGYMSIHRKSPYVVLIRCMLYSVGNATSVDQDTRAMIEAAAPGACRIEYCNYTGCTY